MSAIISNPQIPPGMPNNIINDMLPLTESGEQLVVEEANNKKNENNTTMQEIDAPPSTLPATKSKLREMPGKVSKTLLYERFADIISQIEQEMPIRTLRTYIQDKWGLCYKTSTTYIDKCYQLMRDKDKLPPDIVSILYTKRMDRVYAESIADKRYKDSIAATALAARLQGIDQLNLQDNTQIPHISISFSKYSQQCQSTPLQENAAMPIDAELID